jgi:ribonuclease-3
MTTDPSPSALAVLEARLGHTFSDRALLARALTHPSYVQQHPEAGPHNQRLEFLGDAILNMVLAEQLFHAFPARREGVLTRNRAILARGAELAAIARELDLPAHLRLGEGEEHNGGRERDSILEDAFEAVIAAVYLDSDYATVRDRLLGWYGDPDHRVRARSDTHNPKGRLQELVQPLLGNAAIRYAMVGEAGPDHRKQFTVELRIGDQPWATGSGFSKKDAEEAAAAQALERWLEERGTAPA